MSNLTSTVTELIYQNLSPFTAKNTFTSEVAINDTAAGGPNGAAMERAFLPPGFFAPPYGEVKTLKVVARGILSSTATPTYTFTLRLGTTASTSAAIVLGSAALTTASGISNKGWEFEGDISMRIPAAAGANATVMGEGLISSPAGLVSPFSYELWGGAAQPGTVATVDVSIPNYFNFNVTCSASSASNSIQLLQLLIMGLN